MNTHQAIVFLNTNLKAKVGGLFINNADKKAFDSTLWGNSISVFFFKTYLASDDLGKMEVSIRFVS